MITPMKSFRKSALSSVALMLATSLAIPGNSIAQQANSKPINARPAAQPQPKYYCYVVGGNVKSGSPSCDGCGPDNSAGNPPITVKSQPNDPQYPDKTSADGPWPSATASKQGRVIQGKWPKLGSVGIKRFEFKNGDPSCTNAVTWLEKDPNGITFSKIYQSTIVVVVESLEP